jgi:ATP-dependent RNA helicase SrmB
LTNAPIPETFDDIDLPEPLLRGLAKAGLTTPTRVQQQVIPAVLSGADLLVSAATGSGKTLAFLLPIMQQLLDRRVAQNSPRVLVLVPTRELARQIQTHFMAVGSYTRLTVEVITGGENRGHQISRLRRNPDLLIATPGRLVEHLEIGEAELDELQYLVLDEADRMLDMGFAEQVLAILGHCRRERQSLLFSATLQQRGLDDLAAHLLRQPRTLIMDVVRAPHPDIRHQLLLSDAFEHKRQQLHWLLCNEPADKTLVFVNKRERAEQLGNWLIGQQQRCAVLHGELDQPERKRVMRLFRDGRVSVLIATDLAARGLDVPGVQRVVNFDVPRAGEDYLHRSGRTGRAGEQGTAVTLVAAPEWNRMQGIQRYLHLDIQQRVIDEWPAHFSGAPRRSKSRKRQQGAMVKSKLAKQAQAKPKDRLRDRKNIGKRRKPSSRPGIESGFEPPKRRN